jgi:peptidoglycan/xylan/chitin deacetylase (PgdA/CDA1 family)
MDSDPVKITCINHSDREARRRCYNCLSSICPECQRRAIGHIFCSFRCQFLCWSSERATVFRRFWLRLSLRLRRVEKSTQRITGGGVARIVSLGLLVFILIQTMILISVMDELSKADPVPLHRPPGIEMTLDKGSLKVTGSAPGFKTVVLLTDGKERDVSVIEEGKFTFNYQPGDDDRSVQVQVYGDNLPALYSRALPLPGNPPAVSKKPVPKEEMKAKAAPAAPRVKPEALEKPPTVKKPAPARAAQAVRPSRVTPVTDLVRGDPKTGRVAITFDGGSYGNGAERILDVLKQRELQATFFLTGEFMKRFPGITRRIVSDGHEVGNHCYSHPHLTTYAENHRQNTLTGVTREFLINELKMNEELFEKLTGGKMVPLWRAPFGEQNEAIRKWASEAGYRHVSWTYDPKTRKSLDGLDWVSDRGSALYLSSNQIVNKILSFDKETELGLSGGIVLLHLGSERKEDQFYHKLGKLIDGLEEKGYVVGSVSSVIGDAGGG